MLISSYFFAGNRPAIALRDAAVACFVGGLLFRMLHSAYIAGIKGCIADRVRGSRSGSDGEDMEAPVRK